MPLDPAKIDTLVGQLTQAIERLEHLEMKLRAAGGGSGGDAVNPTQRGVADATLGPKTQKAINDYMAAIKGKGVPQSVTEAAVNAMTAANLDGAKKDAAPGPNAFAWASKGIEAAKNPAPAKTKETSQGQREALTKALYPAKPGAKKDAAGGYAPIEPHQKQFAKADAGTVVELGTFPTLDTAKAALKKQGFNFQGMLKQGVFAFYSRAGKEAFVHKTDKGFVAKT